MATAKQISTSMNFATVVVTVTPAVSTFPPVTFKADTFNNAEEFLGEPQPEKDRAKQFMANDGKTVQYIDIFAKNGKRDLTIFDGEAADMLTHMADSNPQPMFDLSFRYQRNDQDDNQVRTEFHKDCKFYNHPKRAMNNEIAVKKFSFLYADIETLGPDGAPV